MPSATDPEALLSPWGGILCSESKLHRRSRYQELLIPGQGSPEETSPEPQLQRDSGQGDFRGYCTRAVIPVWQPVVTVLAAETRPAPEMPIIEVLTTTQFNSNTANSEAHHLGGDTSTPLQHKPSPSSRVRAEQQDKKPLEKNLSAFCIKHFPEVLTQPVRTDMLTSRPLDRDSG